MQRRRSTTKFINLKGTVTGGVDAGPQATRERLFSRRLSLVRLGIITGINSLQIGEVYKRGP